MSNTYKTGDRVPTSTLADRLDELSEAVTKGDTSPFVMRIPAELDHCPGLVMSQSAVRMRELEKHLSLRAQDFRFMCESAQQVEALLGIESRGDTGMEPIMKAVKELKAQYMQTRDEMITSRYTHQGREAGWKLQLGNVLGAEVVEVSEGIQALGQQYHKLLDGYPAGMTPTDVEKLKDANAELADESHRLRTLLDSYQQEVKLYQRSSEERQNHIEELQAQNARLRSALDYANCYLSASQLNTIGHGSKAHWEMKDALDGVRVYSLAELQAQAVEEILRDLKCDMPETNTALQIFKRLQLRVDSLRHKATKPHQNAGDRGGKGYEREVLGQNNEGDTVTV